MEIKIYGRDGSDTVPARQIIGIVESFEYLRWSRRYSACGGFELKAIASPENIELLQLDNIISIDGDSEVGIIEFVEVITDEFEIVHVQGRFATSILSRRVIWGTEILNGDVSAGVYQIINNHVTNPSTLFNSRRIAFFSYQPTTLYIDFSSQISYKNVLTAITDMCQALDIGFRTKFDPSSSLLQFELYRGTINPTALSDDLEAILSMSYTQSRANTANVAIVGGDGEGSDRTIITAGNASGMQRYETFVDARDLQRTDHDLLGNYFSALNTRGLEKLAELSAVSSFDVDINTFGSLKYKADFDLGDLVEIRSNRWDVSVQRRITEVNEFYDKTGSSIEIILGRQLRTLN